MLETLSFAFWKLFTWVLLFFGLWVFDPFPAWGDWPYHGLFVLFFSGIFYFLWRSHITIPSRRDVFRRLERDSDVKHRPLDTDSPVGQNNGKLWARNQELLERRLSALRWIAPRAILAEQDPYGLRMAVVLFFLCAIWVNGSVWSAKLHDGLFPFFPAIGDHHSVPTVSLWITPPDYTGVQQVTLYDKGQKDSLKIPALSQIKAVVRGGFSIPVLRVRALSDQPITQEWNFKALDSEHYFVEFSLPKNLNGDYEISIRQSWLSTISQKISIVPDMPPTVIETEPMAVLPSAAMKFALRVKDDYGVERIKFHMQLDPIIDRMPLGQAVTQARVLISPPEEALDIRPTYDLTHHHWAGLPVILSFEVTDSYGHSAFLGPLYHLLPERTFEHPVARALIGYRKRLIWEPYMDHREIAQEIELILSQPLLFQGDFIATLAMRTAASRLYYTPRFHEMEQLETAKEIVKLLWDTALRIEDGDLSLASRDLKNARENLQMALQNPETTDQEKAILMQKLKQAMTNYFKELQKEMQKRTASHRQMMMPTPLLSPEEMAQMLSSESLSTFLQKMEDKIMNGEAIEAQEMLSQLEALTQIMDPKSMQAMPVDMQMMQKGMNELQNLIDQQQDLLDQTIQQEASLKRDMENRLHSFSQSEENTITFPEMDLSAHKVEQDALRFVLERLMLDAAETLDNVPATMGNANIEMRNSSTQLGANKPEGAIAHQQEAIDLLNKAKNNLSDQLSQRMQQMIRFSMSSDSYLPQGYDPLGRPYDPDGTTDGWHEEQDVKIPDAMNRYRVQEIQKILRDRSGQYDRPQGERDYYRRLLKNF